MSDTTFVYALLDPSDNKVRYVGKSDDPVLRLKGHMSEMRAWSRWLSIHEDRYGHQKHAQNPKLCWLRDLNQRGLKPKLAILEEVAKVDLPYASAPHPAELRWIDRLIDEGHQLTNDQKRVNELRARDEQAFEEALELGRSMFPPSDLLED